MVTEGGARTLGLEGYGLSEGSPADFVIMDAPEKWEAVRRLAATTLVVRGGEVISETRPAEARLKGEVVDFGRRQTADEGEDG
jgi:cytosine deaminase